MDNEKIACFMATFGISEEEAKQMLADDEAIDHGADLFPLTEEQKKASKQARSMGTRTYTFTKRERKPDPDKRKLIEWFTEWLADTDPIVTNPERQIDFHFNGRHFRIVLSAPRTETPSE